MNEEEHVIEDEEGNEYWWDPEGQVYIGPAGEEFLPEDFSLEDDDSAELEEAWEHALAGSVSELQAHLGRQLTQRELQNVVDTAEQIGSVDAAQAYAASTGSSNAQPSERAEDRSAISAAIGAPDVNSDEGRIQLLSQHAEAAMQEGEEGEEE
jgi:hypothetical protein